MERESELIQIVCLDCPELYTCPVLPPDELMEQIEKEQIEKRKVDLKPFEHYLLQSSQRIIYNKKPYVTNIVSLEHNIETAPVYTFVEGRKQLVDMLKRYFRDYKSPHTILCNPETLITIKSRTQDFEIKGLMDLGLKGNIVVLEPSLLWPMFQRTHNDISFENYANACHRRLIEKGEWCRKQAKKIKLKP